MRVEKKIKNIKKNKVNLLQRDDYMVKVSEKFEKILVKTTKGDLTLPDDFAGKWFVLFSYPSDFTSVCSTEIADFAKKVDDFEELDCSLIGISLNDLDSHMKWIEDLDNKYDVKITFPLISDEDKKISEKLGILYSKNNDFTIRSAFVIDSNGEVRASLHYPPEIKRNVDEVLRIITNLQKVDRTNIATGCNS